MKIVGNALVELSVLMAIPAIVAYLYHEPAGVTAFALTAVLVAALGMVLMVVDNNGTKAITRKQAYMYVTIVWAAAILLGALPYYLLGMPAADAIFESASGYSAMGGTCLVDSNAAGYFVLNGMSIMGMLFWRAEEQLIGGIGIIIVLVALIPKMGITGRTMLTSEAIGTVEARTPFTPRAKDTAKIMLMVYLGLNAAEIVLLKLVGMNWYDAITHAFATVSTGGYSPMANSIAQYNSLPIEIITAVFIVLGGSQLALVYNTIQNKKIAYLKDTEFLSGLALVGGITFILVAFGGVQVRYAMYTVISFLYTCGFANTMTYNDWNAVSKLALIAAMLIGGCLGSTAGGIKIGREVIMVKAAIQEIRAFGEPHLVTSVKMGGHVVSENTVRHVVLYVALYLGMVGVFAIMLAAAECNNTALDGVGIVAAIASSMAGVGPAFSSIWASYASLTAAGKLVCALAMYIGRLEMLPVFLAILHLVRKD
jgi:trk system potassium uptake protein TrkH